MLSLNKFTIKDFLEWLWNERQYLFGEGGEVVQRLAALNHRTWNRGAKNEGDAVDYLTTLYGPSWGADWSGEPGMFSDAITGVDVTMINKKTGLEHGYQAKPYVNMEIKDNEGNYYGIYDIKEEEYVNMSDLIQGVLDFISYGVESGDFKEEDIQKGMTAITDWVSLMMNQEKEYLN